MIDQDLRDEINKRFTLNWLIQGAAQHAGMTFHHLIRDDLNALDPGLLLLYDQYALVNLLQYWHSDARLLIGSPTFFWNEATNNPRHPFFAHPLLSKFGGTIAEDARSRAQQRCGEKGVTRLPLIFAFQALFRIARLRRIERPHRKKLVELAKKSTSMVWGIPIDRLDGQIQDKVDLGDAAPAHTTRGAIWRTSVVGYGCVKRNGYSLMVFARGTNWQLLAKEMVKGTAELICLHGMTDLDNPTYQKVVDAADMIEYEPWMLQTGGELWRRLLPLMPQNRPVAQMLMHIARLPPKSLESLIQAVIERPAWAQELFAGLGAPQEANPQDEMNEAV